MKKIIGAAVAALAIGAAVPLIAVAAGGHGGGQGGKGPHGDMAGHHEMMRGMMGGGHGDRHRGGHGGKLKMMELIETYDADGDGRVTQDEVDRWRAERLAAFDADGNGQLSLDEYQALWLDAMRERMVDAFQRHDDDGDGQVTAEEFGERTARMVAMRDRNDDGALGLDDLRRGRYGDRHGDGADAATPQMMPQMMPQADAPATEGEQPQVAPQQ